MILFAVSLFLSIDCWLGILLVERWQCEPVEESCRGCLCEGCRRVFLETSALDGYFHSFGHIIAGNVAKVEYKPSDLFLSSCHELRAVQFIWRTPPGVLYLNIFKYTGSHSKCLFWSKNDCILNTVFLGTSFLHRFQYRQPGTPIGYWIKSPRLHGWQISVVVNYIKGGGGWQTPTWNDLPGSVSFCERC